MPIQDRQTSFVRDASLIAAARLDCLLWTYARRVSRRTMCAIGLVAAAIVAVAYLSGAELHPSFAGGQPPLLPLVTGVSGDDRA